MKQLNPWDLFPNSNREQQTLEQQPCSVLAICLAMAAFHKNSGKEITPKYDKAGYCKLKDIDDEIKKHFTVKKYKYFKGNERKKLKDYTKFPGIYIVCVKGHYILASEDVYYSFFDNSEDEVIAFWLLDSVNRVHNLKIKDEYKQAINDGKKTFEIRKDDRKYEVGDKIHFIRVNSNEFDDDPGNCYEVTYKLSGCPEYGLMDGYCVLGIKRTE